MVFMRMNSYHDPAALDAEGKGDRMKKRSPDE